MWEYALGELSLTVDSESILSSLWHSGIEQGIRQPSQGAASSISSKQIKEADSRVSWLFPQALANSMRMREISSYRDPLNGQWSKCCPVQLTKSPAKCKPLLCNCCIFYSTQIQIARLCLFLSRFWSTMWFLKMPKHCKVPGCSTKQGPGYSLHDFPELNDKERKFIWAQFCGIDDATKILSQHVICEKHFPSSAFLARNNRIKEDGRNILKKDAVA